MSARPTRGQIDASITCVEDVPSKSVGVLLGTLTDPAVQNALVHVYCAVTAAGRYLADEVRYLRADQELLCKELARLRAKLERWQRGKEPAP